MKTRTQTVRNKIIAAWIALLLTCAPLLLCIDATEEDAIYIATAEEFADFARQCKTDTWSQNKRFVLTADIDLSGTVNSYVSTFGGVLDGGGHTISGLWLTRSSTHIGLFRYVQESGIVRNLHVTGGIAPDGDACNVGGIAGENRGLLDACSFSGTVSGDTNVGGIVGMVTESGRVNRCVFTGSVCGNSYTGGIVGQNSGSVDGAVNRGDVNTTAGDVKETWQDITFGFDTIRSTENIVAATDTGGICGFSNGRIVNCVNYGSVGYRSVGYNTGGICGRQSGWLAACENYGEVCGRKDVGGIVGQAEPYILLEYVEDVLRQLNSVFDRIADITDNSDLRNDAALQTALDSVRDRTTAIGDATEMLSEDARRYTEALTDGINEASDRLHAAIEDMTGVTDSFSAGTDLFSEAADAFFKCGDALTAIIDAAVDAKEPLEEAEDDISDATLGLEKATADFSAAFAQLARGISSMQDGMTALQAALDSLSAALGNHDNSAEPFAGLDAAVSSIADALGMIGESVYSLADALDALAVQDKFGDSLTDLIAAVRALAEKFQSIQAAFGDVANALAMLVEDFDIESFEDSTSLFSSGFAALSKSISDIRFAAEDLRNVANLLADVPDYGEEAICHMQAGLELLGDGADAFSDGLKALSDITMRLSEKEKIVLPLASEMFGEDTGNFFATTDALMDALENLRGAIDEKKDEFYDEFDMLQAEMRSLRNVLQDAYDDNVRADADGFLEDVSDDDNEDETRGNIARCRNSGTVGGDLNVGGIVGALAIEYDFDPEDDIKNSGERTLKYTYKTRCTIIHCQNDGAITAKKHNAGGIIGIMDFGSVHLCYNRGDIAADDGDYVGGIAGKSAGTVRKSLSVCSLSGRNCVGGIVGNGDTVTDCLSLVHVDCTGHGVGSIVGDAELSECVRNRFVSDRLGGIDDISYTGIAEAIDYENFSDVAKNMLDAEVTFRLTFVCDGEVVKTVPFTYSEPIASELIPAVPHRDGYCGRWSAYDFSMPQYNAQIEAEYDREVSLVMSDRVREDGRSVLLLCGSYDDTASVELGAVSDIPPALQGRNIICGYTVGIRSDAAEDHTVRYLPQSDKHRELYVVYGDRCEKVKCSDFGSYLAFSVSASQFTLYEVETNMTPYVCCGICCVLLLGGCCALYIHRKRKKNTAC